MPQTQTPIVPIPLQPGETCEDAQAFCFAIPTTGPTGYRLGGCDGAMFHCLAPWQPDPEPEPKPMGSALLAGAAIGAVAALAYYFYGQ